MISLKVATYIVSLCAMNANEQTYNIYSTELLEFAALGVRFAALVERPEADEHFVDSMLRLLPQLYSSTLSLPQFLYNPDEDYIEEYITEHSYERVRLAIAEVLGEQDSFLRLAEEEGGQVSTVAFVSESLADVYQHIGNLLGIIKERNEIALPSAIGRCISIFREYWGAQLLLAQIALHRIYIDQQTDNDYQDNYNETED